MQKILVSGISGFSEYKRQQNWTGEWILEKLFLKAFLISNLQRVMSQTLIRFSTNSHDFFEISFDNTSLEAVIYEYSNIIRNYLLVDVESSFFDSGTKLLMLLLKSDAFWLWSKDKINMKSHLVEEFLISFVSHHLAFVEV